MDLGVLKPPLSINQQVLIARLRYAKCCVWPYKKDKGRLSSRNCSLSANCSHFQGTCLGSSALGPEAGENTYHIMLELLVYVPASPTRQGHSPQGRAHVLLPAAPT